MKSLTQYPAPNIIPGVNLTAARFEALYAWIAATAADTARAIRTAHQYGLVCSPDGKPALGLEKTGEQLVLHRCMGITPGGSLICFSEEMEAPITIKPDIKTLHPQEKYGVFIEVSQSSRSAFGPESTDLPCRPLYSRGTYSLQVHRLDQQMNAFTDSLCIGILERLLDEWLLTEYVPPCAQIGAMPVLRDHYRNYSEALEELLKLFPQIVLNTDTYQDKSMVELRELAVQLGSFLSFHRFGFMQLGDRGNPFYILEFWSGIARQASFLLQCLKDRPGFYNLLNENTRQRNGVYFTAQTWDDAIQNLATLSYHHDNLLVALKTVDQFLDSVGPVFKALSYGVKEVKDRPRWDEQKTKDYSTW